MLTTSRILRVLVAHQIEHQITHEPLMIANFESLLFFVSIVEKPQQQTIDAL